MASRHSKAKRAKRPGPSKPTAVATAIEPPEAPRATPARISKIAKAEDQHYAILDHNKEHESKIRELRLDIEKTLTHKKSLREAILLKEILGPPIALREIAQHQMPR